MQYTPTAIFDGYDWRVGGNSSGSNYNIYNPYVTTHLGVISPMTIDAQYQLDGRNFTLNVHIEATNIVTGTDNRVHMVITEDTTISSLMHRGLARQNIPNVVYTDTTPGETEDIVINGTIGSTVTNVNNIRFVVFIQDHGSSKTVHQAAVATEGWLGDTMAVSYACVPDTGTVPFTSAMWLDLSNLTPYTRRVAARVNVQIASGSSFSNWKSGWTNLTAGQTYSTNWNQAIPALGSVIGTNIFELVGEDVTPAPYNQMPYPPAGQTDTAACTITAYAP